MVPHHLTSWPTRKDTCRIIRAEDRGPVRDAVRAAAFDRHDHCDLWSGGVVEDKPAWSGGMIEDKPTWSGGMIEDNPAWSGGMIEDKPAWNGVVIEDKPAWWGNTMMHAARPAIGHPTSQPPNRPTAIQTRTRGFGARDNPVPLSAAPLSSDSNAPDRGGHCALLRAARCHHACIRDRGETGPLGLGILSHHSHSPRERDKGTQMEASQLMWANSWTSLSSPAPLLPHAPA